MEQPAFKNSINIPFPELRQRVTAIPYNKPIVVHCADGCRSAAGSSIVNIAFGEKSNVYDLGESINTFLRHELLRNVGFFKSKKERSNSKKSRKNFLYSGSLFQRYC
jgi:hypothetical protein